MNRATFVQLFSTVRLRTRLMLIALTAVLPALAVIIYDQAMDRSRVRERALEESLRLAKVAAGQQSSVITGARRLLTTLAEFPDLRADTPAGCAALLPNVLRDHPGYTNIIVIDASRSLFCAGTPLGPSPQQSRTSWFDQVLREKRVVVGDYQLSATTGQPAIVVAQPLLDQAGEVRRIIVAGLTLRAMGQMAAELNLPRGAVVTLFDRNRVVLARHPESEAIVGLPLPEALAVQRLAAAGREAITETAGADGQPQLEVTVPVISGDVETHLYVTLGLDRAAVFAAVNENLRGHLALLLLVAVGTVVAAAIAGELFVLRPAGALHAVTARVAAGDLTARAALDRGGPGLAELASAVNSMASALEIRQNERDAAERELRASEERYRQLFDESPHAMWVYDTESFRFLAANRAAIQRYGYTHAEYLQMTLEDVYHREDWPLVAARAADGGEDRVDVRRHRTRAGDIIAVEAREHLVHWNGRRARLVLLDDITERLRLEEQLRQTQRIEAIGLLAGGIAHDFNNLLTAIQGYAELLSESVGHDHPDRSAVDEIGRASHRAAELTRQLLAFSRKQILAPRVVNLGDVVRDLTPMLRRLIGETVHLKAVIDNSDNVRADPGQLQQVLMNLVVNARDAMPEGGRLTIETADVLVGEDHIRKHPFMKPGPYVMLSVRDTGHGMDATTQSRIFDPFFTTKPQGRGTGLGLSTVYGIVKQSGGYINVESEVGGGTTFDVYLPRTDEPASAEPTAEKQPAVRGNETILLVEDNETVAEFTQDVLKRCGYAVHMKNNPHEALEFVRTHPAEIHLLVSDVVLPEMNGRALATELHESHPETRVLYMSGYADHAIVVNGVLEPGTPFLQKPFTAAALAHKVREILDGRAIPA